MKIENVFGHKVIRIQCNNIEVYKNKELTRSLDQIFNLPEVKKFDYSRDSQVGTGLSFSDHKYLSLVNLPGSKHLVEWVTEQMLSIRPEHTGVKFVRSWSNRIFQGCMGRLHNHATYSPLDLVAVLYVDVPTTGGELVFVNGGEDGKTHLDYDPTDLYYIQPKQGELIIHDASVYHTVATHTEDMMRTVFVFDIDYTG